jgi:hypothetical protein
MNSQTLGGFGGPELILIAAIVLLLVGASLLPGLRPTGAMETSRDRVEEAASRAYLDRLLGLARRRVPADGLPGIGTQPRTRPRIRDRGAS